LVAAHAWEVNMVCMLNIESV